MVYLIREVTDYCVLVIIVPEAKFRAGGWGMCKSGEAKRNRTNYCMSWNISSGSYLHQRKHRKAFIGL